MSVNDTFPNIVSRPSDGDLWIFGYGSLMWHPGFDYEDKYVAHIEGYHRSFCIISHVHRGTVDNPGLVLGLDLGGSCIGIAFRVAPSKRQETITYLRKREQVTNVYIEAWLSASIEERESVNALTYVANRTHPQYSGALPDSKKIELLRNGHGISGANRDYILSTYEQLQKIGIQDPDIARLAAAL